MALPEAVSPEVAAQLEAILKASAAITRALDWSDAALADRNAAIVELRRLGWTVAQVSEFTQLSEQQVYKISRNQGVRSARTVQARAEEEPDA